jgi:hypothetical protein
MSTSTSKRAEKIIARVEAISSKVVNKTFGKQVKAMSLAQQCKLTDKMIGIAGTVEVRRLLLKGLPDDVKEYRKRGQTSEEIISFFWDCDEFKNLWTKLGLEKTHLEVLVR